MWLTCGQVLIREIVRLRTENSPDLYAQLAREEELVKLLDKFQFVLLSIGAKVPVFREETCFVCTQSTLLTVISRYPV